jgi:hypothetical protein
VNPGPQAPDAVLSRVRKLLALAESPNVHEAAAAAAAAQALIARHRLAGLLRAEAEDPITDGREAPLETTRRLRKWKIALASGLARANGCVAYTAEHADQTLLLLAGRAADRDAVQEIWKWLVQRLELLSATHGAGKSRAWHEAFRIGAAEAVVARLAHTNEQEQQAIPVEALVRVEHALADRNAAVDAFTANALRLKAGRTLRVDANGFARGRAAGATTPLK